MFETSFLLCLKTLLINIIVPLIPGILFLWIFYGKKFQWMIIYILWWFIGIWVIAFSLFNLQFIYFWIWVKEYLIILWVLILVFIIKLFYKKDSIKEYSETLKIKNIYSEIKTSFFWLSKIEKIFTIIISLFSLGFIIITFIQKTNFPTYADDSFGNRNKTVYNIYQDDGIKIFWEKTEILGRWRLGYPIYIPIYKATITNFMKEFNDIYINIRQWLSFLWLTIFIFIITFKRTKNIFYSVLPIGLVISLPLVFFHSTEGYMELPCAIYSVITVRAFWKFLEEKDYSYISLWLLLWFILSHLKNDWLLWYFAWIIISFVWILLFYKELSWVITWFIKNKRNLLYSIFYFVFFLLPFLIVRWINHLWLNPTTSGWWTLISKFIHREIFTTFHQLFIKMDNYNLILIIIVLLIRNIYKQKNNLKKNFLFFCGITILIIFILVFLLTENYLRVMDQTTVNRVFSMSFIIILSFSWILFDKNNNE